MLEEERNHLLKMALLYSSASLNQPQDSAFMSHLGEELFLAARDYTNAVAPPGQAWRVMG